MTSHLVSPGLSPGLPWPTLASTQADKTFAGWVNKTFAG